MSSPPQKCVGQMNILVLDKTYTHTHTDTHILQFVFHFLFVINKYITMQPIDHCRLQLFSNLNIILIVVVT